MPKAANAPENDLSGKRTLTAKEVEKEYNLCVSTLANWRSQKRGPLYSKAGKIILYRRENIERFLDRCQQMTTGSL